MFRTITPIFSIILAFVIYFAFTSGVLDEIRVIQTNAESFKSAIEKAVEYNATLEKYLGVKHSLSALDTERINAFVPQDIDEVRLLVDLEALARKNSMLIGNLKVNETRETVAGDSGAVNTVTPADFNTIEVEFGLIGTYEQFRAMLSEIEKSLVLMEVTDISFVANEGPLQQFDLTVRAYSLNPVDQQQPI